ncbi:MAG: hypothetical protein LBS35_02505 [Synergistaceae bacterium]|nr:hypothetical protein [Synergistaceae bacterium]
MLALIIAAKLLAIEPLRVNSDAVTRQNWVSLIVRLLAILSSEGKFNRDCTAQAPPAIIINAAASASTNTVRAAIERRNFSPPLLANIAEIRFNISKYASQYGRFFYFLLKTKPKTAGNQFPAPLYIFFTAAV